MNVFPVDPKYPKDAYLFLRIRVSPCWSKSNSLPRRSFENGPFPLLAESSSGQSFGRQRFGLKKGIDKKLEAFFLKFLYKIDFMMFNSFFHICYSVFFVCLQIISTFITYSATMRGVNLSKLSVTVILPPCDFIAPCKMRDPATQKVCLVDSKLA